MLCKAHRCFSPSVIGDVPESGAKGDKVCVGKLSLPQERARNPWGQLSCHTRALLGAAGLSWAVTSTSSPSLSCRRGQFSLPARVAGRELRLLRGELMGGAAPGAAGPPGKGDGGGQKDDFGFAGERFLFSEGVPFQAQPALPQLG